MKNASYVCIAFLCCLQVNAQPVDLSQHQNFFQQQSQVYQNWLEKLGLTQAFSVKEVQVFEAGMMLNLQFVSSHPDTLTQVWESVKVAFEKESLVTLEEALFLKVLRLMDLRSDQAAVQISNDYTGLRTEYYIRIYTEDGMLKVDKNLSKGFFELIQLDLMTPERRANESELKRLSKTQVHGLIKTFIDEKFKGKQSCPKVKPSIDAFSSLNDKLLINVSGLCREVLSEEEDKIFCAILNRLKLDCSSVEREALHFEFYFDEDSKKLYCQLDGKYSNDYLLFQGKVRDMDDKFEDFLITYGENFLKALKKWIEEN